MKPPTPTRAVDALIGDEEQDEKQKKEKERNRERAPKPTIVDTSVTSYDPQRSHTYFLNTPTANSGRFIVFTILLV